VKGVKVKGNKLTDYKVKDVIIQESKEEEVKVEAEEAPGPKSQASGSREKAKEKQPAKPAAVVKGKKDNGPRIVEFEIVPKGKESVKEFNPKDKKGKAAKGKGKKEKPKGKEKKGKNQMKLF
jgi:hypothetical protein